MADEKGRSRKEELDEFWNLEDLVPQKKKQNVSSPYGYKCAEPVDVSSDRASKAGGFADQPITVSRTSTVNQEKDVQRHYVSNTAPHKAEPHKAELEYVPDKSLIHSVKVFPWESRYNYYEQFRLFAEKYFSVTGRECPRIPYFSYVPQYNQLRRDQLAFYFWLRTCIREEKYIDADYSYILLFIYETINLSGEHDYLALRDQLFGVWMAYREKYIRLDVLLCEWIFDFCLIHQLPPPKGKIPLSSVERRCGTAEFYVSAAGSDTDKYVSAMLNYCTSYDYRKSKFYGGEHAALYDRYIPSVLRVCLAYLSSNGKMFGDIGFGDSKASREAYVGSVCSYRIKKRIEIEFCSFSRSHELRYLVGDIVKYAENIIRSYIGVKSKLSVYSVPQDICELITKHLREELPPKVKSSAKKAETHEFDKFYEPLSKELSLKDAARIENESWETTRILVEAFAEEDTKKVPVNEDAHEVEAKTAEADEIIQSDAPLQEDTQSDQSPLASALGELCGYVKALLNKDDAARRSELSRIGRSEEVIVDRVNEIAADIIGDIIIDGEEGSYEIIEDYFEQLFEELSD